MIPILAYDFSIDPGTMNWIIGGIVTGGSALIGGAWMAIKKLCEFLKPYIIGFFTSQQHLVDTMAEQVPIVTANLAGINATLERLGETQKQHGETLNRHGETLQQMLARLDGRSAP